ncbi:hypothetical protein TNCV_2472471 [Trichonephila clavipes]|nr:hypothetical protein TNCV_2472471 [Trichonephila clavipes]
MSGATKNFPELRLYAMALENLPKFQDICEGTFPYPHGSQPVPIELSITSIPEDGKDPEVICLTVDHSNLLTTAKDSWPNRYINERLSLKIHLPGSVPLEYLSFYVRGKFCHLAQGNRGFVVFKGSDQRKFFEKLGLFTINLEILPHFRDLNDRTLSGHLHDGVHEDYVISECTKVKSYRYCRTQQCIGSQFHNSLL